MPNERILEEKKKVVDDLVENLSSAKVIVIADYRGITVEQDNVMRRDLSKAGVEYKVVKNTLTKLAVDQIGLKELDSCLKGPTSIAFSKNDIVAPAKILKELDSCLKGPTSIAFSKNDIVAPAKILNEYSEKYGHVKLKAGVVEGKVINVDEIKALAKLPPKEVLLARVLGGLNAPLAGLVNVLNANIAGLARVLNKIAEKKESA